MVGSVEELERRIIPLLPGLDCGACGRGSCAESARELARRGFCVTPCARASAPTRRAVDGLLPLHCTRASAPAPEDPGAEGQALTRLFERYHGYVARIVRLRGVAEDSVHDLVQQVFLMAWLKRSEERIDNVKAWLAAIARNVARLHRSRGARRRRLGATLPARANAGETPAPDVGLQAAEAWEELQRHVAGLPARMRRAWVEVHIDGNPVSDVAGRMGISEKTVYNMMASARAKLRRDCLM